MKLTPIKSKHDRSKRPDPGDHDDCDDPQQQVEWCADPEEVGEAITAGAVDHHVCLIADGCHETGGGGQDQGHQEGEGTGFVEACGFQAEGKHQDGGRIVGDQFGHD